MSIDIGELRRLLDKLENWPKNDKGYPAESPSLTIIRLHKLTDEALPALLDVAEAAEKGRHAYEMLRHHYNGSREEAVLAWVRTFLQEGGGIFNALARLDFWEGT